MALSLKKPENRDGAVTFLDVLGWKGIWQKDSSAIYKLSQLINYISDEAQNITNKVSMDITHKNDEARGISTNVLSISDTIAIFTPGPPFYALKIHAEICQLAIPESIKRGIPLRGATSYGRFSTMESIMLGPAVDESASWHESTDWMGVILSPSAKFQLRGKIPDCWIEYPNIPYKKGKFNGLNYCVDWEIDQEELYQLFSGMGPYIPEIASKYLNTFAFLEWRLKVFSDRTINKIKNRSPVHYNMSLSQRDYIIKTLLRKRSKRKLSDYNV